jgi:hypothetical protein
VPRPALSLQADSWRNWRGPGTEGNIYVYIYIRVYIYTCTVNYTVYYTVYNTIEVVGKFECGSLNHWNSKSLRMELTVDFKIIFPAAKMHGRSWFSVMDVSGYMNQFENVWQKWRSKDHLGRLFHSLYILRWGLQPSGLTPLDTDL